MSIEQLKQIIEESNHIVFFGGAGVSTESGIPDFRSETGLYHAQQKYGRSPEEMLSHTFFMKNTEEFFDYYKNNLIYQNIKPNKAHLALAKLEAMGKLEAIITQNIDGLHQLAGSQTVYELHGSVLRNNCMKCGSYYDLDFVMDSKHCIDRDGKAGYSPFCESCGDLIKPDVILYEESLDEDVIEKSILAIERADTLIVGGTSLVVYPAAGLIRYFKGKHLVLINRDKTPYDNKAEIVIRQPIGEVLGSIL